MISKTAKEKIHMMTLLEKMELYWRVSSAYERGTEHLSTGDAISILSELESCLGSHRQIAQKVTQLLNTIVEGSRAAIKYERSELRYLNTEEA